MGLSLPGGPVTIVFSDVERSTDLRTDRGDVAAHRILRAHEQVVRRCIAAHDGREVKALGDGFMLAFGSVRGALECSVAIQQALTERNAESPGEEVRVRIGVNTGEVVVEGDDLYGQAVNAAARIAAKASGGEILVSDIVRQLTGSGAGFTFTDRGEQALKGFPQPWRLHALVFDPLRAPTVPGAPGRTPFVGRQAERVELRKVLDQVRAGTGAFVLIGGEPGVGKTRVAEELARRCESEGFLVYTGHCYEMAGAAPYIPIVETYEQGLARAPSPAAFAAFLGAEAPQVAKLVPRLRQLCPEIPAPLELPPEQERRFLFNSLWEVLARTARRRPTLLVFDDIHWADEPTMLLIQHIAERLHDVPLLLVGLYRDSELDVGRPLSQTFEELTRRRLATRLTLRRLAADSVAEMITALAGQDPPPGLVEVIYAQTEGNPFFTEEVFKHLAEEGRLFDADGRFRADLSVDDLDVPEGVRVVVGARLRRLGEDGTALLGSAAVLGRVFSFEVLRYVEELPEARLLDLVEAAERAGLLVAARGSTDDEYMFAHELIRQTVLGTLSAPRRRRLHVRVAEAFERFHAPALKPHAATIAHHLLEAGSAAEAKRTFGYLLMAGVHAQETAAFEEALRHLQHAADLLDAATPAERIEVLTRLGRAQQSTGHGEEAIATLIRAVDVCEAAGEAERAAPICIEIAYACGWASRFEAGVDITRRGLAMLGTGSSPERASLLAYQGLLTAWVGGASSAAGEALLEEALAIAAQLGNDPMLRGACLSARSLNRYPWERFPEAAEDGLEAARLFRLAGNPWEEASVLGFTQDALAGAGRFPEVVEVAQHLGPLAERVGHVGARFISLRGALVDSVRSGDLADLEDFARAELRYAVENGVLWEVHGHAWVGLVAFLRGSDEAYEHLTVAADREPPGAMHGFCRALLMEYLAYAGHRQQALEMLSALEPLLPSPGQHNQIGRWKVLASTVEVRHLLDERSRADALYELVLEYLARTGAVCQLFFDLRLLQRVAGIAAHSARRFDDAERHYRIALQQAAELPHVPEQAHTRRFYAGLLLERDAPGDRAEAATLATEAAELYRRMGMPRHLALAEALLAR